MTTRQKVATVLLPAVVVIGLVCWSVSLLAQEVVPFPPYETFKEVEKGEIATGSPLLGIIPGFHRTFANDIAYEHFKKYIEKYKKGETPPPFPEGAILTLVNYEKDKKTPRLVMVIVKHKNKEFGQTGGWG